MHNEITLLELPRVIKYNLQSTVFQPIILLSAPGMGKSAFFREVLVDMYADYLGVDRDEIGFVEEKPARRDAAEIAGVAVPWAEEDGTVQTRHSRPPLLTKILATGKKYGILLWDELAAARDPEQKVAADSFDPDEHAIGGWKLPRGWIVVGTGNRAADKSGSMRLMAHLTNRAMVKHLRFSFSAWKKWAESKGINPIAVACAEAYHEDKFFAEAVPTEDGPFCTPRSFVRAAMHLDAFMADPEFNGSLDSVQESMIAANIGTEKASLLAQFMREAGNVPSAAEIMADPDHCMVPDQTGFQMIAAHRAMGAVEDRRTAAAALHYIVRLRTDLQVSLGVKLMKIVSRSGWSITDPLARDFLAKFQSLIPLAFNA